MENNNNDHPVMPDVIYTANARTLLFLNDGETLQYGTWSNLTSTGGAITKYIKETEGPMVSLSEVLELLDLEGMNYDNERIEMALINFKNKLERKYGAGNE